MATPMLRLRSRDEGLRFGARAKAYFFREFYIYIYIYIYVTGNIREWFLSKAAFIEHAQEACAIPPQEPSDVGASRALIKP